MKLQEIEINQEILEEALVGLEELQADEHYGCDVHHILFNTDYFIIGTHKAKTWLEDNVGVFDAIEEVCEYENFNFGQVTTSLQDAEKLCNMYVYIKGEELLQLSKTLDKKWNDKLSQQDLENIINELAEYETND